MIKSLLSSISLPLVLSVEREIKTECRVTNMRDGKRDIEIKLYEVLAQPSIT